jgi:signal transduction histidine kinase
MKEKYVFLFICELAALAICVYHAAYIDAARTDGVRSTSVYSLGVTAYTVLYVLTVCCLFGIGLWANLTHKSRHVTVPIFMAAVLITYFTLGLSPYAVAVLPVAVYGLSLHSRIKTKNAIILKLGEDNENLRERIAKQRQSEQTAEHFVRLNERNRIAVRLHDKVGHGISGSVMLLEGALLNLEKNPETAKMAVGTAAENLRTTVDEIRQVLKEERQTNADVGPTEIAGMLLKFETDYPHIKTELILRNTDEIAPDIWHCISENLTEAFTNLLKHSSADRFKVSITAERGLTRAEFADNGKTHNAGTVPATQTIGMGLSAMRERTAFYHGRLFINTENGFVVTQIFTKTRFN